MDRSFYKYLLKVLAADLREVPLSQEALWKQWDGGIPIGKYFEYVCIYM